MSDYKPVIFENSLGETISNDPVFLAQRTLARAGVNYASTEPSDSDDSIDGVEEETNPYAELKGPALKKLAADRGVDITGLTKVGEVRAALLADDAAKAEAGSTSDDDEE